MLFCEEMNESILPPSYIEALTLPSPDRASTSFKAKEEELKPKLCRMEKTSASYGFHLNGIQGVNGQYIMDVRITKNEQHLIIISNQSGNTRSVSGGEGRSSSQGRSGEWRHCGGGERNKRGAEQP